MRHIPTPGVKRIAPRPEAGVQSSPLQAIVLDFAKTVRSEARVTNGLYCNVLVVSDFHELKDVLVLSGGGWVPNASRADVVDQVRAATRQRGRLAYNVSDTGAWGSFVLVEFINGIPITRSELPHPWAPGNHLPRVDDGPAPAANQGSRIADEAEIYNVASAPDRLPPTKSPRVAFAEYGAIWVPQYKSSWRDGFLHGWQTGEAEGALTAELGDTTLTEDEYKAVTNAMVLGVEDGARAGVDERNGVTAQAPTKEQADYSEVTADEGGDQASGDSEPATTTGLDMVYENPASGSRVMIRADGAIFVDARDTGSPVYIQGGKVVLSDDTVAMGIRDSIVRLGAMDASKALALWPELKAMIKDEVVAVYNEHTHSSPAGGSTGLAVEQMSDPTDAPATTKVRGE